MALREDYRELLLDAAVLVVSRDGLDHATTKAIAKEAACNEVYIYRNFGSKEGLLQAAFDRADIHFIQMVIKHLDVLDDRSMTLEQRCHALWQPVWAFCLSGPDIIRFYLRYYYSAQYLTSARALHHHNYQQLQARLNRYFISEHDCWLLMAHIFETILSFVSHVLCGDLEATPELSEQAFGPGLPHAAAVYAAVSADPNLLPLVSSPSSLKHVYWAGRASARPGFFSGNFHGH